MVITNPTMFFPCSEKGTDVTLGAGNYDVRETGGSYKAELGDDCSGVIHTGETKICITINTISDSFILSLPMFVQHQYQHLLQ